VFLNIVSKILKCLSLFDANVNAVGILLIISLANEGPFILKIWFGMILESACGICFCPSPKPFARLTTRASSLIYSLFSLMYGTITLDGMPRKIISDSLSMLLSNVALGLDRVQCLESIYGLYDHYLLNQQHLALLITRKSHIYLSSQAHSPLLLKLCHFLQSIFSGCYP